MLSVFAIFSLLHIIVSGIDSLQIISIDVPSVIQNGSRSSVVLDCEYRYEQYEVPGLEVKWFWNQDPEPVYQWIPGKKPEAMGILKGRVDLRHRASKDRNSLHRAVEIMNPTTDLTGNYKCRVSSFHDEDFASKKMIVYAPAESMNMTFVKNKKKAVTFYCSAVGVFPQPTIKLFLLEDDRSRSIKPYHLDVQKDNGGTYSIFLEAIVKDKNLPKEALMQCILHIPGTNYRIRRQVVYFPDFSYRGFDGCSSSNISLWVIMLCILILLPSQVLITNLK
ncbi:UNVERIFIED_CONTAM: hypothetical protein RMT77_000195 [Armadillidium vulgare]